MGKAKKRNFNKCVKSTGNAGAFPVGISRKDAIFSVFQNIKDNKISPQTKEYIGLFGITEEELAEAGVSYESLVALKHLFL